MLNKILLPFFLLICFSCQTNSDNQSASIANDICTCFTPLMDTNIKIQSLIKNGKGNEAEDLLSTINKQQMNGNKCAASLVEKYGAETQLDTDKISEHMKQRCPKILAAVEETLFSK